jgi:hypothetical protein
MRDERVGQRTVSHQLRRSIASRRNAFGGSPTTPHGERSALTGNMRRSSTGRSRWCRPANSSPVSAGTPVAESSRMSVACATTYRSRAVLPAPGSPLITRHPRRDCRASFSRASIVAHSCRRPSNPNRSYRRRRGRRFRRFDRHPPVRNALPRYARQDKEQTTTDIRFEYTQPAEASAATLFEVIAAYRSYPASARR